MAFDAQDRQALRDAQAALGRRRFNWSAERIALLKQRWAEGLSASTIARELGPHLSRCAVLGKVHRLKLVQPEFKRRHFRKEQAAPKRRCGPRTSRTARAQSQLMAAFQALGLDPGSGAPDLRTVHQHAGQAFGPACSLLELTATTCRWPVGEPGEADFAFCGAAPLRRYPYCVAHCLIAYRPESAENAPQRAATPARPVHGLHRAA
ncbi:MAG TPA: GcrA family cell cycle regulator [Xanthobacteraceae bacterium]